MEDFFQSLFEHAPGLYLVLDDKLEIVAVTEAYLQATNTERAAIVGRGVFDVFPDNPDDPAADGVRNLRESLERVIATGLADTMAVQKYPIRRPERDGGGFELRYWSPSNSPVLVDGRVKWVVHRVEDVTAFMQQHTANEALRTQADRMSAEIVARAQELQVTNARLRAAEAQLRQANESLERRVAERTEALTREMDARAAAEAQLRQAQKMEALGLLAGGVAHDFNNLLTVILSAGSFVSDALGPGHPVRAELSDVIHAAERAAVLTRQLLTFSRRQVTRPTSLNLNEIVRGSEPILRRLLGPGSTLLSVCADGLRATCLDRGAVEQVLLNLVVNARDAMPGGGTITIETANVELDAQSRGLLQAPPGAYVMLAVTDSGTGIDPAVLSQLFVPFFTTKPLGRGTGLGLATVHGVVKASAGDLLVHTALGKGTSIKVFLPVDERSTSTSAAVEVGAGRATPSRILLVEDEPAVRDIAAKILSQEGHEVRSAASPAEALALSRAELARFELVVTDVVMPEMDGPAFLARLEADGLRPRALFMSGYTGGALVHQRVLESCAEFLQKPFTPRQLIDRVNRALRGGPPAAPGGSARPGHPTALA